MAARNDITGDVIATKAASDAFRNNFDAIFRKPKTEPVAEKATVVVEKATIVEEEIQLTPEELAKIERDNQTKRWWAYVEANQVARGGTGHCPTFAEFRDTVLPTLNDGQYMKFIKG
jgi:hypothetical protein